MSFAETPSPPYYAVIFTTTRTEIDSGYSEMASKMEELAKEQDGYLGIESARTDLGITISYWRDLESIKNWKMNTDHQIARNLGKEKWYKTYKLRIAIVERDYDFSAE